MIGSGMHNFHVSIYDLLYTLVSTYKQITWLFYPYIHKTHTNKPWDAFYYCVYFFVKHPMDRIKKTFVFEKKKWKDLEKINRREFCKISASTFIALILTLLGCWKPSKSKKRKERENTILNWEGQANNKFEENTSSIDAIILDILSLKENETKKRKLKTKYGFILLIGKNDLSEVSEWYYNPQKKEIWINLAQIKNIQGIIEATKEECRHNNISTTDLSGTLKWYLAQEIGHAELFEKYQLQESKNRAAISMHKWFLELLWDNESFKKMWDTFTLTILIGLFTRHSQRQKWKEMKSYMYRREFYSDQINLLNPEAMVHIHNNQVESNKTSSIKEIINELKSFIIKYPKVIKWIKHQYYKNIDVNNPQNAMYIIKQIENRTRIPMQKDDLHK